MSLFDLALSASEEDVLAAAGWRCFACGVLLKFPLRDLGSLRCQDCREQNSPLDPRLLAREWKGD